MQEIWYKNKPTLIKALATLVVFLVLSNVAKSMRSDHETDLQRYEEKSVVLAQKLQELDGVVDVERQSRSALEDRGQDLWEKIAISARPLHSIPEDLDSIATEFKRSKDAVWNDFKEKANRLGIMTPSSIPNFEEKSGLSPEEWQDRYRMLEVLDKFLSVILQIQLESVAEISPGERSQEEFEDSDLAIARYPVTFRVTCSPAQISELFARFQSDNSFLSIEPERMKSLDGSADQLEVTLRAVGLDVESPREENRNTRRSPRSGRRG
ncbi:MAG: hypothetical protein CBC13_00840 [Planctomycetia bacterium TMED53]|nr:MAG: hypothetical protein CBC13_00840 [Planctomycetia bacterium TMED53]